MSEVRIDKWMWAVRIFKTRNIAAEACKKNHVIVNNIPAKPSRMIAVGDIIHTRKPPVTYSFKVLNLTANRVGAKVVSTYLENITSPEQYEILELQKIRGLVDRPRGMGRPTKKDRRNLNNFFSSNDADDVNSESFTQDLHHNE